MNENPQITNLQNQVSKLQKDLRQLIELSVRAELAGGVATYLYSELPSPARQGLLAVVTNGRKSGEGAGAGTGVLAVTLLLAGTIQWVRADDNTQAVAI